MKEQFDRTARIIGERNIEKLAETRILLFGIGGWSYGKVWQEPESEL